MSILRGAFLSAMLLLVSCASHPAQGPPGNAEDAPSLMQQFASGGLPAVPQGRLASAAFSAELNGCDDWKCSGNAVPDGSALRLISGANSLSWAVWRFSPRMADLVSLEVVMTVPDGEQAYIGLAEYNRNAWHFSGPVTTGQVLPLANEKHRSGGGAAAVAVVTTAGDTATVFKLILHTVSDWQIVTVDERGSDQAGYFTSLIDVQGSPAICYGVYGESSLDGELNYVRAEDPAGATWGEPLRLDSGHRCMYISAETLGIGQPSVCWATDIAYGELRFAYATDLYGETWAPSEKLDGDDPIGSDVGFYSCLTAKGADPAISYYNSHFGGLKYKKCSFGTHTWGTSEVVVSSYCYYTSLVYGGDGRPLISYVDDTTDDLMVVGRNPTDTGWNPPLPIDNQCDVAWASGALVNADLAVSYSDHTAHDLKYAYYDHMDESWHRLVVDDLITWPTDLSLAVVGGVPAISYHDQELLQLKYVQALDSTGKAWGAPEVVDTIGWVGNYSSLAEIDGKPAISYQDANTGSLMFAIRLEP